MTLEAYFSKLHRYDSKALVLELAIPILDSSTVYLAARKLYRKVAIIQKRLPERFYEKEFSFLNGDEYKIYETAQIYRRAILFCTLIRKDLKKIVDRVWEKIPKAQRLRPLYSINVISTKAYRSLEELVKNLSK